MVDYLRDKKDLKHPKECKRSIVKNRKAFTEIKTRYKSVKALNAWIRKHHMLMWRYPTSLNGSFRVQLVPGKGTKIKSWQKNVNFILSKKPPTKIGASKKITADILLKSQQGVVLWKYKFEKYVGKFGGMYAKNDHIEWAWSPDNRMLMLFLFEETQDEGARSEAILTTAGKAYLLKLPKSKAGKKAFPIRLVAHKKMSKKKKYTQLVSKLRKVGFRLKHSKSRSYKKQHILYYAKGYHKLAQSISKLLPGKSKLKKLHWNTVQVVVIRLGHL